MYLAKTLGLKKNCNIISFFMFMLCSHCKEKKIRLVS